MSAPGASSNGNAPKPSPERPGLRPLDALLAVLAVLNLVVAGLYLVPVWQATGTGASLTDRPDFTAFWAAGGLALEGRGAEAYDWALARAAQGEALGVVMASDLPFLHPPPMLAVFAPFAALPFWPAMALWTVLTAAAFAIALWQVLPGARTLVAAAAAAPTLLVVAGGQTGFLTAALLAVAVRAAVLRPRPAVAGPVLALLALKPTLLAALPVALIAGGRWQSLSVAAAVGLALAGLSAAVFGAAAWSGFADGIARAVAGLAGSAAGGDAFVQHATLNVTLFGLLRAVEIPSGPALAIHGFAGLAAVALTARIWADPRVAPGLKAALVCYATAIATPRLYPYETHVLLVGAAFQIAHARAAGFRPFEAAILTAAYVANLLTSFVFPPLGCLVGWLLFGHCLQGAIGRKLPIHK
ncbi:MAG: glycosyltransferase family 87 protein [Paracoccaceae bacterium]